MAKLCHAGHPSHQPADPDPTADVPQRLQRARSLSSAPGPSQTTTRGAAQYIWLIYATCRLRSFGSPLVRRKRASIHMYRGRSGYLSWRIAWSGFEVDGDRTLLSLLACTMPGLSAGPQTYERASYVWGRQRLVPHGPRLPGRLRRRRCAPPGWISNSLVNSLLGPRVLVSQVSSSGPSSGGRGRIDIG